MAEEQKPTEVVAQETKQPEVDLAAVKKQVEYYFSDANLSQDAFFHKKISEDAEGWLGMDLILSCKKIQVLQATQAVILEALKDSMLETKVDGDNAFIRRTQALPELAPRRNDKKQKTGHEGGAVFAVSGIPEGKRWGDVKDVVKVLLPAGSKVQFSTKEKEGRVTMLLSPFDGDIALVQELKLKIDETDLVVELCQGDALKRALQDMPKHVVKRREQESSKRKKAAQVPIILGEQKFPNANSLRGKVKEILQSRQDGQQLKPESPDYLLVKQVLENHPRAEEKLKGMVGIKVDQSPMGGSRCFFLVREDGSFEDISVKKCIDQLEVKCAAEPKVATPAKAATPEKAEEKVEEKAEEKVEEKAEEKVEEKAEEKVEEKAEEEAAKRPLEGAEESEAKAAKTE